MIACEVSLTLSVRIQQGEAGKLNLSAVLLVMKTSIGLRNSLSKCSWMRAMFSRAFSSILVKISSFGIRAYNRDKITLSEYSCETVNFFSLTKTQSWNQVFQWEVYG